MNRPEKSVLRVVVNGLCLFGLMGMFACSNNKGSEESEMASEGAATAESWDNERFYNDFSSNNYFKVWDQNGDTFLDDNEYLQGEYRNYDTNRDNQVDQEEWRTAHGVYGRDTVGWADWDIDASKFLDDQEYGAGFNRAGWVRAWDSDGDGRLSDREFSAGMFKQFDRNGDGQLDAEERRAFQNYQQRWGGSANGGGTTTTPSK
ncbi:EF-hand domain-containing protein [Telluribacter sp. SYSU D00476]|uniref:EF-hand domain-containing protein n=1 Tax=Telluribacter sp. SYSU D00476 TaxID=2811430 RepID=UPI001FF1B954|nr:hypothetical protein [Telluribacter sp. SYSU D00476]